MAGGKQTPRQKMINLMYLVFIAMLALNMSKEVLAAFGLMNEKLEASNEKLTANNADYFDNLKTKSEEDAAKYGDLYKRAQKVKELSDEYYTYLEGIKNGITEGLEDPTDYVVMDKPDYLDGLFFQGDNLKEEGQNFLDHINNYREGVKAALTDKMTSLKTAVDTRFATSDGKKDDGKVEKRDGTRQDWINYHYEGFPAVASLTKLTQLQADIKTTEQEVLSSLLEGNLREAVSLKSFKAKLFASKSAFYGGEKYDGKIVVSKTDNSATPESADLKLDGRPLTEGRDYKIVPGGIQMLISAGAPGDHKVTGTMYFMQDGEKVPVEVEDGFATISKPNAAVISADKMNVVYRGVDNPMTISIPGIPDNKVTASAPGLSSRGGSKYVMKPGTGYEVTINASGVLPDGQKINTPATFRIKDIPRPTGTIRGEDGTVSMPKSSLEKSTVGAKLFDFDFDLDIAVSSFKIKVPGQPTINVNGNKLDARAQSALNRAQRGDVVQIFDITAYITNNKTYKLPKVSGVMVEITN